MDMKETSILMETLSQPFIMDSDPPFQEAYKTLLYRTMDKTLINSDDNVVKESLSVEKCELPLIDLNLLNGTESEKQQCKTEIARASMEWGFFQVVNHGISGDILEKLRIEQVELFKQPFEKKSKEDKFLRLSAGSYRWGTPSATCLRQLSWSEAFHISLPDIFGSDASFNGQSLTVEEYAVKVSSLAQSLAEILSEKMGYNSTFFQENCLPDTCYLRMNRYPPCPIPAEVFGLMPHTDSDFLTILHQDQVGGLQLVKEGKWIAVKPNPEALIINIGDLFQAWSNDVYKSVQHRVVTNSQVERFSIAYFLCPSYDTVIQTHCKPSVYKQFSFGEFRRQVQEDVHKHGHKIGLPRFLV